VHYFSGYIAKLAAAERVPVRVVHFRNTEDGQRNTLARQAQRALMRFWINRYATRILAVNEGSLALGWRENWRCDPRCQVIYNGFDLGKFADAPDVAAVRAEFGTPVAAPVVIHIGRLDRQKNHPRLLALFAALAARQPEAVLWMIYRGEAAVEASLKAMAADLGIADRVRFIGERHDVPRLLQAADLLLLPSLWEGLPGVVLESCLAGTPVLATDLPGVREIGPHFPAHVRGLALGEPDAAWAEAAVAMLADPPTPATREDAKARFAASIFHIDRCIAAHEAVWGGR
jgi:glycosyltransferase involved in cell wall biosynthesis